MTSSMILLRVAAFMTAFIAVQSVHGRTSACEDARAASKAPLAQTDALNELRAGSGNKYAQSQQNIPIDVELATGDGQQGSPSTDTHHLR
jgi:hypothetical protein